ncbi:hypothetical protein [Methylobacterium radiotolerans]|uniref:Uncharacterized protein n=1 Tax=Methylobacterium radiotolerans (strain ATCC 27329 / DSM 1819 / JCM 2831 / NBRC 15690 / NCIMB 10815 / 0-1) TaxID=426355 RepID=B1MA96_METRJ|nr:hypothetical protein [Methylobacterium radiotolerans]ACB28421.1 hypothetical protein Mrad2831_6509 [Methylobacterium radiotolerans JCM 2831]GEN01515.1 hypothetical protein MRA01_60540 [Methylobacterium radiotolerans]
MVAVRCRKRTIFPTICHEVDGQARRVRRGGVAKGIDPAAIAAENRRSVVSAAQDGGTVDVIEAERIVLPAVPPAAPDRPSAAQHEDTPKPEAWSALHTPEGFHAWQIHTKFSDLLLHPPRGSITAETVKAAQIA